MGREVTYTRKIGTPLSEEEVAMIETAGAQEDVYDSDNPFIEPDTTPELYAAMMNAVAERNRRVTEKLRA